MSGPIGETPDDEASRQAKMNARQLLFAGHFFFLSSNKDFSLRVGVLPKPRCVRYAAFGSGKGYSK